VAPAWGGCTDIGTARVADGHPKAGEKRRCHDASQLACELTHIAALPGDAQHADVTSHVQPGAALPTNVRTLEVTEGSLEIACLSCGK
jgi:hypothetical protein